MKTVLDTNVIIAAFASRGLGADLFELCLMDHTIVISNYILNEIEDKLLNKIHLPESRVADIRHYLEAVSIIVVPVKVSATTCRDADDAPIIGTALATKDTVLVTGDKDLLSLIAVSWVKIVSPRQFWEMLKEGRN